MKLFSLNMDPFNIQQANALREARRKKKKKNMTTLMDFSYQIFLNINLFLISLENITYLINK